MTQLIVIFLSFCSVSLLSAQNTKWNIQTNKAKVEFKVRNFGFWVDGSFTNLKGDIKFNSTALANSSLDVSLKVSTIETGNDDRDEHLRSDDYFNAEKYPTIRLRSINIKKSGIQYRLTAKLTIKDVTKTVTFPFYFNTSGSIGVFTGHFEIDRRDFNIGGSSFAMGDNVKITIYVPVSR